MIAAISIARGANLQEIREAGESDEFELIVSTLNQTTGVYELFSGSFTPPTEGSDLVTRVRFPEAR